MRAVVPLMAAMVLAACAPIPPAADRGGPEGSEGREAPASRTLIGAVRREPASLSLKMKQESSLAPTKRLFNGTLAILGEQSTPNPYLAESLPRLNTESWRVLPDGGMETTYRLRAGLAWHDGARHSADDFVFAWRVYTTPGVDVTLTTPQNLMEEVVASDERTLVIRWRGLYPEAGILAENFPPLPRHILGPAFEEEPLESFLVHPYWTREYVGVGPYRVERWEPGSSIEGSSFAAHALGRPRIDRIRVLFMADANTVLANLLSEAVHVAFAAAIQFQQGAVLKNEWTPRSAGTVLMSPGDPRFFQAQFRESMTRPRALLDVRVRRALAYAIDKQAFVELLEGLGSPAHTMISPREPWYPAVDRAITRYPYDLRRSEQLMGEAGLVKASDGFYASAAEGRFNLEVRYDARSETEREVAVLVEGWRRAAFDAQELVFRAERLTDGEFRASFPALLWGGPGEIRKLASNAIPTPQNRWVGTNRGSWSSPEYDRLFEAFNVTLDPQERTRQVAQMMRLVSDELPVFTTYNSVDTIAYVAALRGISQAPTTIETWNIYEWELR